MIRGHWTIAGLVFFSAIAGWSVTSSAPVREGATVWWAPSFEYDHKRMEVQLAGQPGRQAWIDQGGAKIQADRIFWNRRTRIGRCYDNVTIIDITNETVISGGEAWHYADESHSVVRINPKMRMNKDDVTVYADEMHRFGKEARAEARGRVRIEAKDGTAWGDLAVYHQKRGELVLSGDPWLEQKTNIHRANEIVFFRNDNKVALRGQAKLMQGRDHVRAEYIEIIDLDRTNGQSKTVAGSSSTTSTNRKNRLALFRDDVRIFRYNKKNELESVTVGEEGEFYEQRGYVRLSGNPRLTMVNDNTSTSGAVMEQYRDQDLAIIKGNAFILHGYRTVNAQLIRYDTKTKLAELAGNPVITEYGDSYRADYVTYDTARDIISWRGSTMAVVGTEAQSKKEAAWSAKHSAASFSLGLNANGANIIKVVGDVWLSTTGKASTNQGQLSWGKRATETDAVPAGTHLVITDTWSWIDLLGRDGLMLRLRGPAHLVLSSSDWERATETGTSRATPPHQGPAQASSGQKALIAGGTEVGEQAPALTRKSLATPLTNLKGAAEISNSLAGRGGSKTTVALTNLAATNRTGQAARKGTQAIRRVGRSLWILQRGMLLARPRPTARLDLLAGAISCSNLQVPFLAESSTNGFVRLVALSNQPALLARVALSSLKLVSFRSNSELRDFQKRTDPVLTRPIVFERPLALRPDELQRIERVLEVRLTNELERKALALSNTLLSNKTLSNKAAGPENTARPGRMEQARLVWPGPLADWISTILRGQDFWQSLQLPKKQTEYGERIDEARKLSIVWGGRSTAGRGGGRRR